MMNRVQRSSEKFKFEKFQMIGSWINGQSLVNELGLSNYLNSSHFITSNFSPELSIKLQVKI